MRAVDRPRRRPPPLAFPAAAVGALAFGALAIGALAIARLAIKEMAVKRARFGAVEIDDLTVRRLRVIEHVQQSSDANSATP
jgi:hypothetical protein